MKILMINKFYFLKGGAERVMFDTIDVLENNGHTVIPFAMKSEKNIPSKYEEFFVEEINFQKTKDILKGVKNMYSFEAQKNIEKLIKQERPDVAHVHNSYFQISPSILSVLKKYNIPVVMTVHDYNLICPNYKLYTKGSPCEQCKGHKYYNAIKNNCSGTSYTKSAVLAGIMTVNKLTQVYENHIDAYITPSHFMKNKLAEWSYTSRPVIPIANPVDSTDVQTGAGIKGDYIIYAGRFSSEKGVPVFLKALKKLPHVKAKLIGDGPLKPLVTSMVKELPHVEILPYTHSKQELFSLVKQAQATIVPSQWYENYPMSVVESLAVGTPVIGSRIGGIPELVVDGKTGYTFEPGNSDELARIIEALYGQMEKINQLGKEGITCIKQYNNKAVYYQQVMKVYESVR